MDWGSLGLESSVQGRAHRATQENSLASRHGSLGGSALPLLLPPSPFRMSRASQPATRLATATATPGLRPVTLPQLPSAWSKVTALKAQLVGLESEIAAYAKVEKKLETITDEPTWQAMVSLLPSRWAGSLEVLCRRWSAEGRAHGGVSLGGAGRSTLGRRALPSCAPFSVLSSLELLC